MIGLQRPVLFTLKTAYVVQDQYVRVIVHREIPIKFLQTRSCLSSQSGNSFDIIVIGFIIAHWVVPIQDVLARHEFAMQHVVS